MIGNGVQTVFHCENATEADYEFCEGDAPPVLCPPDKEVQLGAFTPVANCDQGRFDYAVAVAHRVRDEIPSSDSIRVWYDAQNDYTRVEWNQEFGQFGIRPAYLRIYKVHSFHVIMPDGDRDLWACPTVGQVIDYAKSKRLIERLKEPHT